MNKNPRLHPYTEIGIRRVQCFRCGEQAQFQWQICADQNQYRPICKECDIELNKLVLEFMGFENREEMITKYTLSLE